MSELIKFYNHMAMTMDKRTIVLIAYPKEKGGELKSLFTNDEGSIKRKLENPPLNAGQIRYAGWDLRTLDQGKIIEGQYIRVQNGNRKSIDLYNDGALIFTGLADEGFLAHASEDGLKINSIALIELAYNFISFYKEVINDFNIKPNTILMQFRFINMHLDDKKSYLVEGPSDALFSSPWKHEAPLSDYSLDPLIEFKIEDFEKEKIAATGYKVIEKIYLWFGIPLDSGNIPYTKIENSVPSIDIEAIRGK